MSVSIRPNHTAIGVPQWRHNAAYEALSMPVPDMTGLTLTAAGVDYDLYLPDSVWLTVMEDLQEHFARKAVAQAEVHTPPNRAPSKGDAIGADWRKGCGQRRGDRVYGVDCTHHVGIWHVAANTTRALEVWS